ncbi:MAG: cytochrome C [Proteobacteria bacterium]|nr:cytochrome C [Pseudomonadota bacterium]
MKLAAASFAAVLGASVAVAAPLDPVESLGKSLFFDADLSVNGNQSCSSCHEPEQGFSSPMSEINAAGAVIEGSVPGRFGNRKPPSVAYASPGPVFHHTYEDGEILFVGGAFHDGRATGHQLGSVVADQALGPFVNPAEMALPSLACVVERVCGGDQKDEMEAVWGKDICEISFPTNLAQQCADPDAKIEITDEDLNARLDTAMAAIAKSIAAYEASPEVNRYSSRFDGWQAGTVEFTEEEKRGFALFEDKALCAECHVLDRGPNGEPPLLTDFTFDNLGVPKNPDVPWYTQAAFNPDGKAWIDPGLGGMLRGDPTYAAYAADLMGAQKVPTLRNINKRLAPDVARSYMHNGYFKTLEEVVHFYNTRDTLPRCEGEMKAADAMAAKCWPAPEVEATMNKDELGNLKMTPEEEADLVAFLKTLDDE